jgi:hypothetical protein
MSKYLTHSDLLRLLLDAKGAASTTDQARQIGISLPMLSNIYRGHRRADGDLVLKYLGVKRMVVFVREAE